MEANLAPSSGLTSTIPNGKIFKSVLLSFSHSPLLCLLLKWGWLAVANLNLCCVPPAGGRVEDWQRLSGTALE